MRTELPLKAVLDELDKLLEQENALLLAGRYGEVGAIAEKKVELSATLDRALIDPQNSAQLSVYRKRLASIVSRAQDNEQLLAAANSGVALAKARLREIMNRERNVGVYGETGNKPLVPDACVTRRKFA